VVGAGIVMMVVVRGRRRSRAVIHHARLEQHDAAAPSAWLAR